jgi:hypothetical protein
MRSTTGRTKEPADGSGRSRSYGADVDLTTEEPPMTYFNDQLSILTVAGPARAGMPSDSPTPLPAPVTVSARH